MKNVLLISAGLAVLLIGYVIQNPPWNLLESLNENLIIGNIGIQLSALGFCLTSTDLMDSSGHVEEDNYSKQSIYSVLYSLYDFLGTMESDQNVSYRFTFNTWGIGPSLFDENDPERFGKTAYKSLILFDEVQKMITEKISLGETLKILEVGCGTGAGANLLVHEMMELGVAATKIKYTALDMQLAAITTCKALHESISLECVQGNGMSLTFETNAFDMIIISETHIAEIDIDPETEKIIDEIIRVLKNNGLFLWGNALFTRTWTEIIQYLPTKNFKSCGIENVTKGAILARDGDKERCDRIWEEIVSKMVLFRWYPTCKSFIKTLLFNFYRMPGTNLYNTMVNGTDSYMQICSKMQK